jgi:hypothetical protein
MNYTDGKNTAAKLSAIEPKGQVDTTCITDDRIANLLSKVHQGLQRLLHLDIAPTTL